jgi:hypothetical protein
LEIFKKHGEKCTTEAVELRELWAEKQLDSHSPADHHYGDTNEIDDEPWCRSTNGIYNSLGSIEEFVPGEILEYSKWVVETADGQTNRVDFLQVNQSKQLLGLKFIEIIELKLDTAFPNHLDILSQNEK